MPTDQDLELLSSKTSSLNKQQRALLEEPMHLDRHDPKAFNFEYSLRTQGELINLNKKEIEKLIKVRDGTESYEFKVLNEDMSFISNPDYSPIR